MKTIILLFFSFLPATFFGQTNTILRGTVTDSGGEPLPYVNIGVVGTSTGTVSSLDGTFQLYLSDAPVNGDTLRFSMVGYESRSFALAGFITDAGKNASVQLPQFVTTLGEVVVRPRFDRKKQIGMERSSTQRVNNFAISSQPNQNLGAEIGRKFRLPGKEAALDTFRFFVLNNNFDTVGLRLNIYEMESGKPGENLLNRPILIELTKRQKGWIKVDLTPYQLFFSENVIVSVEWIYHSQKGTALSLPIRIPAGGTHFYKYGSQGTWKKFPSMSTAMLLDVSY